MEQNSKQWRIEAFNCALTGVGELTDSSQVWSKVFRTEPEEVHKGSSTGVGSFATGEFENARVQIQSGKDRVAFLLRGREDQDPDPLVRELPIESLMAQISKLCDDVKPVRLGLMARLSLAFEELSDANAALRAIVPAINAPDDAIDLNFSMNVRRSLEGTRVQINRNVKWNIVERKIFAYDDEKGEDAAELVRSESAIIWMIDINTLSEDDLKSLGIGTDLFEPMLKEFYSLAEGGYERITAQY